MVKLVVATVFVVLFCAVIYGSEGDELGRCRGAGEVFNSCGTNCTSEQVGCSQNCVPKCECLTGFVRKGQQCVQQHGMLFSCTRGAVHSFCGGCDQRCNEEPVPCPRMCRTGCFCPVGRFRNAAGTCVKKEEC